MNIRKNPEILLEAGTNELEIVEFRLGDDAYGINVAKVREIIRGNVSLVPVPDAHPAVMGVVNLRGKIIPVINLAKHLGIETTYSDKASRIIITEFLNMFAGFYVNEATRIHRLSWQQVEEPSMLINAASGCVVGVVKMEERVVFLLDFEKIASLINPDAAFKPAEKGSAPAGDNQRIDRGKKTILVAEDSPMVLSLIIQNLKEGGYGTESYKNGMDAWNAIKKATDEEDKEITDFYNLLITDIEMPQMDGLHLIKKIREHPKLENFPCLVFSSMISEKLSLKCKSVGADGMITKPEIPELLKLVDEKVLQRTEDRGQRAEDRGQRTEDRGQRTEDRGQRAEDRGQRAEDR